MYSLNNVTYGLPLNANPKRQTNQWCNFGLDSCMDMFLAASLSTEFHLICSRLMLGHINCPIDYCSKTKITFAENELATCDTSLLYDYFHWNGQFLMEVMLVLDYSINGHFPSNFPNRFKLPDAMLWNNTNLIILALLLNCQHGWYIFPFYLLTNVLIGIFTMSAPVLGWSSL